MAEKPVEIGKEVPPALVIALIEFRKLKEQQAHVLLERLTRFEEGLGEQVGIQEILVGLPGSESETRQVREFLDGDFISHFEGKLKVFRHLRNHPFNVMLIGKLVVGGIDADRIEDLGVFGQAIPVEAAFREFASSDVAVLIVKHPAPAGVFP